mmetsp:Transcript_57762/g.114592  ORF Transcript_57762/g.114592 Transcript_57762/m.114592 type:complete len:146 (-) Transcript_57762:1570-2007(-)
MIQPRTFEALTTANLPGPSKNGSNGALQEAAIAKCCRNNCKIECAGNRTYKKQHSQAFAALQPWRVHFDRMQNGRVSSHSSLTCIHTNEISLLHITSGRRSLDACHLQAYRSSLARECSSGRPLPQPLVVVWATVRAPDAYFVEK